MAEHGDNCLPRKARPSVSHTDMATSAQTQQADNDQSYENRMQLYDWNNCL